MFLPFFDLVIMLKGIYKFRSIMVERELILNLKSSVC